MLMTELRQRISYPQVRVVGALLILQGVGLMGLGVALHINYKRLQEAVVCSEATHYL